MATSNSGFQDDGGDWASWFSEADATNGTWTMADMTGDGRADLVFIKTANTRTGYAGLGTWITTQAQLGGQTFVNEFMQRCGLV